MKLIDWLITEISLLKSPAKKETVQIARSLKGKKGIEIGGPSNFFSATSYFPVYLYAAAIDGVNYSSETVWEGKISAGKNYQYLKGYEKGEQFIAEATDLDTIKENSYDFLLSCHCLEHVANPIKALKQWHAIIKPGGLMCLILPNKEYCFDRNRPYTSFEHLLEDYKNNTNEYDETHFEEIYKNHIIAEDPGINSLEELKKRTRDNFHNRCVHHHVFNFEVIIETLRYCGFEINIYKVIHGVNLFIIATKPIH